MPRHAIIQFNNWFCCFTFRQTSFVTRLAWTRLVTLYIDAWRILHWSWTTAQVSNLTFGLEDHVGKWMGIIGSPWTKIHSATLMKLNPILMSISPSFDGALLVDWLIETERSNFQEYITCSTKAVEKSCGKEAGEYIRKLLTRSAGDFIEIACVSHKTGKHCAEIK